MVQIININKYSNCMLRAIRTLKNCMLRATRTLKSRHSLGNNKTRDGWRLYHFCSRVFQTKTKRGMAYSVPTSLFKWINVSNNVTTAPPCEVAQCVT